MHTNRFYSLDVLRGFAALSVVLGHFVIDGVTSVDGKIPQASQLSAVWNFSFIYAVDFFLVLSGFILTHSYFHRMELSFKDFTLRRFLRLYPLHFVTLLATIAIYLIFELGLKKEPVLLHLLFIHNLGFGPSGLPLNVPAWTISIEFWLNVALFAVLLFIRPNTLLKRAGFIALAGLCFALVYKVVGHMDASSQHFKGVINLGLVRCLGTFTLGILTYELYLKCKDWQPAPAITLAGITAFFAIILFMPGHVALGFVVPLVFMAVVLVGACAEAQTVWLSRYLVWLGNISFAVYLVHNPILRLFRETDLTKSVTTGLGFVLVTILVAGLLHRYFERPFYIWSLRKTALLRATDEAPRKSIGTDTKRGAA